MTMTDRSTVVGVFTDRAMAERAIEQLHQAGFHDEQIGYVSRDSQVSTVAPEASNDTAAGAATGAVSGGVLGGVLGAAAALLIPGFGPAIAGGILAATLGGAALGAVAGGLVGALTGMGIPEEEARYYQDEFETGRTIVTVKTDGRYEEALNILRQNGAYDATARPATTQYRDQPAAYNREATRTDESVGVVPTYNPNEAQYAQAGAYQQPTNYQHEHHHQHGHHHHEQQPASVGVVPTYDPNAASVVSSAYDPNAQRNAPYDPNAQPNTAYNQGVQRNAAYDPNVSREEAAQNYDATARPGVYDPVKEEATPHSVYPDTYDPKTDR